MTKKQRRNQKIIKDIDDLRKSGYKVKEAFPIVAEKYFISSHTVRDIWYKN